MGMQTIAWGEIKLTKPEHFKKVLAIADALAHQNEIVLLGTFNGKAVLRYKGKLNKLIRLSEQKGEEKEFIVDMIFGGRDYKHNDQKIYYRDEKLIEFMRERLAKDRSKLVSSHRGEDSIEALLHSEWLYRSFSQDKTVKLPKPYYPLDDYRHPHSIVICTKKQSPYNRKDYEGYLKYGSLQYIDDVEPPYSIRRVLNRLEDKENYYYLTILYQLAPHAVFLRRLYLYPAWDNIALIPDNDEDILKKVFEPIGVVEAHQSGFRILPKEKHLQQ
jgi:hypothetical protein